MATSELKDSLPEAPPQTDNENGGGFSPHGINGKPDSDRALPNPPATPPLSSLQGKQSETEEPTLVEFLRARLLSERGVTRASRQYAEELASKIQELEHQLELEMQLRKKAEASKMEVITRYREFLPSELATDLGASKSSSVESNADASAPQSEEGNSQRLETCDAKVVDGSVDSEAEGQEEEEGDCITGASHSKGGLMWEPRRKHTGRGRKQALDRALGQSGRTSFHKIILAANSSDGEASPKKWIGKSVRQIKKKDGRLVGSEESNTGEDVGTPIGSESKEEGISEADANGWADLMMEFLDKKWNRELSDENVSTLHPTTGLEQESIQLLDADQNPLNDAHATSNGEVFVVAAAKDSATCSSEGEEKSAKREGARDGGDESCNGVIDKGLLDTTRDGYQTRYQDEVVGEWKPGTEVSIESLTREMSNLSLSEEANGRESIGDMATTTTTTTTTTDRESAEEEQEDPLRGSNSSMVPYVVEEDTRGPRFSGGGQHCFGSDRGDSNDGGLDRVDHVLKALGLVKERIRGSSPPINYSFPMTPLFEAPMAYVAPPLYYPPDMLWPPFPPSGYGYIPASRHRRAPSVPMDYSSTYGNTTTTTTTNTNTNNRRVNSRGYQTEPYNPHNTI